MSFKIKEITSYSLYDVETTGLNPNQDRILEHGCIRVRDNKIVDELRLLANHNIDVPVDASNIHGLTRSILAKDGIDPAIACKKVIDFLGDDLVGGLNNIPFDYPFLEIECNRFTVARPKIENWFDLGMLSKGLSIGMLYNEKEPFYKYAFRVKDVRAKGVKYNLNFLAKTYEVENLRDDGIHTALNDLKMTKYVFDKIKEKYFL